MSNVLETLVVKLVGDISGFSESMESAGGTIKNVGKGLQDAGGWMTATVTAPLLGIGAAAIKSSVDLNAMMGNIQSLGLSQDRVVGLKSSVQDLAIEMGKGTDDMADGLYQVVSAFGDTSDSVDILKNAAETGAAGLATTTDALNLLATVTKGYGDESLDAQKKVSDLAFQTVNLGQTTFPELASSMGKVVPLAAALGVSQEELFAQMATLTGVTGTAAEVTTQLRATYQGILSPTKEMASSIANVAYELDKQGKLSAGPLVDRWRNLQKSWEDGAKKLFDLKNQLATVEDQMSKSGDGAKALNDQLKQQRLETEKNELALKQQLSTIDTSTEEGKAQAQAIRDQIEQLNLLSQQRELDLQSQLAAMGGSESLKEQYKQLTQQIKEQKQENKDLGDATDKAAAALGQSVVDSVGLTDALKLLSDQAGGNTDTLSKMFGSVEALNAVLALSGGQAESFQKKLEAMKDAGGATDAAFKAQTEGMNAAGFSMEQVKAKTEVLMQRLGDGLAPTLMKLIDNPVTPLLNKLADMVTWFANSDSGTQQWIITIAAVAAAVGPALMVIGTLISTLGTLVSGIGAVIGFITGGGGLLAALGFLLNPVGLIVAALGGLAYAWYNNWGGIRDWTDELFSHMDFSFQGLRDGFAATWEGLKALNRLGWEDYKAIGSGAMTALEDALGLHQGAIAEAFTSAWNSIRDAVTSVDWLGLGVGIIKAIINGITITASSLADAAQTVAGEFWSSLKSFLGLNADTSLSGGNNSGYGGNYAPVPVGVGGGSMYNINVTVYVNGYNDPNSGATNGARSGVLEALRAVGLG